MNTRNIEPNVMHYFLTKLEEEGKLSAIVTQNIDGLHQKAGSHNVYEIHGSTRENYCTKCGKQYDGNFIFDSQDVIPKCLNCGGMVRPDVVLYGENIKYDKEISNAIFDADLLIVGGTSLQVYPANTYVHRFAGRHLVVINREELEVQLGKEDMFIKGNLGDVVKELKKLE